MFPQIPYWVLLGQSQSLSQDKSQSQGQGQSQSQKQRKIKDRIKDLHVSCSLIAKGTFEVNRRWSSIVRSYFF